MTRFPVGGPREAVYSFLRSKGFRMSNRSDKEWAWGASATLLLYGSGSEAVIYSTSGNFKGPLEDAVKDFLKIVGEPV